MRYVMNLHRLRHRLFLLMAFLFLAVPQAHAQATEKDTPPESIRFGDKVFRQAWSVQPSPDYVKYEYLPDGESFPNYSNMLLLEKLTNGVPVAKVVQDQVERLKQHKQSGTDPVANYRLVSNEKTGEFLLDFLLSTEDADGKKVIEWNVYRYGSVKNADGPDSVLLFAYSRRAYGDGAMPFMQALKQQRAKDIDTMIAASMPAFAVGAKPISGP